MERTELAAAWERNATQFIAWARSPGHDSYWQFHRDAFLSLLPPPGRQTLDLGCGEGRLARDLRALGHVVVGVDASPTMLAAAREAGGAGELVQADAAALPFADASFDLVVAFMSLQDVDDMRGAVAEAGRVLEPGGCFCLAVVHPINSAGRFEPGEDPDAPFVIRGSYLAESYYEDTIERDGLTMQFVSVHRPLQAFTDALADAGLVIERVREVEVPGDAVIRQRSRRWQRVPIFLHIRALKPGQGVTLS